MYENNSGSGGENATWSKVKQSQQFCLDLDICIILSVFILFIPWLLITGKKIYLNFIILSRNIYF